MQGTIVAIAAKMPEVILQNIEPLKLGERLCKLVSFPDLSLNRSHSQNGVCVCVCVCVCVVWE